jgi:hypothetical protein
MIFENMFSQNFQFWYIIGVQLYGIVVGAPDFGPKAAWFETRAWRIFHDLGKVSEY